MIFEFSINKDRKRGDRSEALAAPLRAVKSSEMCSWWD